MEGERCHVLKDCQSECHGGPEKLKKSRPKKYVVKLDKEYHEFLNSYWNYYETYLFKEKKLWYKGLG